MVRSMFLKDSSCDNVGQQEGKIEDRNIRGCLWET